MSSIEQITSSSSDLNAFLDQAAPATLAYAQQAQQTLQAHLGEHASVEAIDQIIACLDLTSLNPTDTTDTVSALAERAKNPGDGAPPVAAVCVWPDLATCAHRILGSTSVKVATVAGAFPHGRGHQHARNAGITSALTQGADEIDTVINRADANQGHWHKLHSDIHSHKHVTGTRALKVILETGELTDATTIAKAAWTALLAGATYVKTSTGKSTIGATDDSVAILAAAVSGYQALTGNLRGVKPSGGVRTLAQAVGYTHLVSALMGSSAAHPDHLRIGASTLLDTLLEARKIVNQSSEPLTWTQLDANVAAS